MHFFRTAISWVVVALCLCAIAIFCFHSRRGQDFKFKKVSVQIGSDVEIQNPGPVVDRGKVFIQKFLNSYRDFVATNVPETFRASLPFAATNVSVRLLISPCNECAFFLYPASDSELNAEFHLIPPQLIFFDGCDPNGSDAGGQVLLNLSSYSDWHPWVSVPLIRNFIAVVEGDGRDTRLVSTNQASKFYSIPSTMALLFRDMTFMGFRSPPSGNFIAADQALILLGDSDCSNVLANASGWGRVFAVYQIQDLYIGSQFFRDAFADAKLRPVAQAILDKKSRSEKDSSFHYPLWQFKKDLADLKSLAIQTHASVGYDDELYKSLETEPNQTGVLFWYYSTYSDFMLQWAGLNLLLLAFLFALLRAELGKKLAFGGPLKGFNVPAVAIIVNSWVFSGKPPFMPLRFWLLPGLLFLAIIALPMVLKPRKERLLKGPGR